MKKQEIIRHLYQSTIKENLTTYRDLFKNTNLNEVTDPYWKESIELYNELSSHNKEVLFKIIEQIEIDTLSTILRILDEGIILEDEEVEFDLTIKGNEKSINGDLQDLFLEYDEENR
ncbi:transposase [Cerasibacillus sp. JNUCC 74]